MHDILTLIWNVFCFCCYFFAVVVFVGVVVGLPFSTLLWIVRSRTAVTSKKRNTNINNNSHCHIHDGKQRRKKCVCIYAHVQQESIETRWVTKEKKNKRMLSKNYNVSQISEKCSISFFLYEKSWHSNIFVHVIYLHAVEFMSLCMWARLRVENEAPPNGHWMI